MQRQSTDRPSPAAFDDVFQKCLQHLAQGNYSDVETLLLPFMESGRPRVDYLLGLAALGRDEVAAARTLLARAVAAFPDDAGIQANWAVCLYRNGQYEDALAASDRSLHLAPKHADNHFNRGLILLQLNSFEAAARFFQQAADLSPQRALFWVRLGETKHALGRYPEAELAYRRAIDIIPGDGALQAQISALLYDAGIFEAALEHAERAAILAPELAAGWAQLSAAQRRLGQLDVALANIDHALQLKPADGELLKSRGLALRMLDRLDEAAQDMILSARIRFAPGLQTPMHARELRRGTRAKLKHDIEQFEHLHTRNCLPDAAGLAQLHRQVLSALPADAAAAKTFDLPASTLNQFHGCYNRLHHLADAGRQPGGALNPQLDSAAIEADYLSRGPGICWIDGLLSQQALAALHRYCQDSTFWFDFHHVNGYLGAFFEDGFAAPLLLQIADELRRKLPRIFRDYPLIQLWAFKYDSQLDGIELHADIAAINLNFWITPDSANLDPESGGLVVWDKKAPAHWNFDEFNTSTTAGQQRIQRFLADSDARPVRVPYRQNRAVLFNSDLFHRTDSIRFAEGYENRRINITMLFGHREGRVR